MLFLDLVELALLFKLMRLVLSGFQFFDLDLKQLDAGFLLFKLELAALHLGLLILDLLLELGHLLDLVVSHTDGRLDSLGIVPNAIDLLLA